jgi:hypothetical protein
MNASFQRYLMLGLGGIWCVIILMRLFTAEAPQEVPLTFVSGKPATSNQVGIGAPDPWQVKRVSLHAHDIPDGPKKNIFAPLGGSTEVGSTTVSAKRVKQKPPASVVAAIVPVIPPGPTPEELAEQAARQQEELTHKQVREQMGQYRYLGYLNQHGVHKAFVGKGTDIYIIRIGDKLDGKFLVASIDPTSVKLKEPTTNLETSLDLTKEGNPGTS